MVSANFSMFFESVVSILLDERNKVIKGHRGYFLSSKMIKDSHRSLTESGIKRLSSGKIGECKEDQRKSSVFFRRQKVQKMNSKSSKLFKWCKRGSREGIRSKVTETVSAMIKTSMLSVLGSLFLKVF